MLELNTKIPNFTALGSDEKIYSLEDFLGKNVILYFYPRDNTPGCSTEACDFRDNISRLSSENTVVIGVSRDSVTSHNKFIQKFDLPFLLLSDKDEELCKLFDVIKEKNMYGKKVFGIERSTFIIDKNGFLIKEYRKVKVKGHVDTILNDFKEFGF